MSDRKVINCLFSVSYSSTEPHLYEQYTLKTNLAVIISQVGYVTTMYYSDSLKTSNLPFQFSTCVFMIKNIFKKPFIILHFPSYKELFSLDSNPHFQSYLENKLNLTNIPRTCFLHCVT